MPKGYHPPERKTDYCPLCGAHESEFGEGETPPEHLEGWKDEVKELAYKLFPRLREN